MKSWILLHLGLHLAAGKSWLGRFAVKRPYRVLYIDEEMAESELARRVGLLSSAAGIIDRQLPFYSLNQTGVRFSPSSISALCQGVAELRPDVVIVETLRRVIVGSENEAVDVAGMWRAIGPLAQGRTFILSHHMKKPGQAGPGATRHRASGSTDILAGSDSSYGLMKSKEEDGSHVLTLECTKLRGAMEPPSFTMVVKDSIETDGVEIGFGEFLAEVAPAGKAEIVLALCEQYPTLTHKDIYEIERENLRQLGVSRATFYRSYVGRTCCHQKP